MTEQKICETCDSWGEVMKYGQGAAPAGEFKEPEQKSGCCRKHNDEVKSAHDTCPYDDWEPKK